MKQKFKQFKGIFHHDNSKDMGHLFFKSALLMDDGDPDTYLAQFDALYLKEAFGWTRFKKQCFVNITPLSFEEEKGERR